MKLREWLTNGKKMIIGALLFGVGLLLQCLSRLTLAEIPFLLMAAGTQCFVCALCSKIAKESINLVLFVFANLVICRIAIEVISAKFFDGITLGAVLFGFAAVLWAIHGAIVPKASIGKRIGIGFVAMFGSVLVTVITFLVPILLNP